MSKQLQEFDLNFVKNAMREWNTLAQDYENATEKVYSKLRSYLTLHQFRLNEKQKCEIREMLSQELDELEKVNFIEDMDNYLDGFCFKLDKSILPKRQPTEVKINIAPQPKPTETIPDMTYSFSHYSPQPQINSDAPSPSNVKSQSPLTSAFDLDYDIYEMMFNS